MQENELKKIAFRINAIFYNEKNIKVLGFSRDKETGVKTDISAVIWIQKQNGDSTKSYIEFTGYDPKKGDLLLTSGSFSEWNEKQQYTIHVISGVIKSKFNDENKTEPTIKKETTKAEGFINSEEKLREPELIDVPWELDL